ncbi:unnamed protein product [Linum trigynum]|uniref:Fe2OG dioxygenase domain-containing protein n=1 Tax=Linum trigynum TaxID=586398 RepID=A0AAV2DPG1_9ROSI
MGSYHEPQKQLPTIDLSRISPAPELRGTEEWDVLCRKVREACEEYGCFEVVYEPIPVELRAETFSLIRRVFELPAETKALNFNPKPYHGYTGVYNLYESLGIEDASNCDCLREFAGLMWPEHNGHRQYFCKTVGTMMKQLEELWRMVEMLILDSYGLTKATDETASSSIMECKTLLRIMQYKAPPMGKPMSGLPTHTDKPLCTFLCDDQVSALQIELSQPPGAGEEQFISVPINPTSFLFIVGDPLMAWSNGRMHAVKHRVLMSGTKARYSLGAFQIPVEGTVITAPEELVDDIAGHPKLFKDFDYKDFINFSRSKEGTDLPSHRMIHAFAASADHN